MGLVCFRIREADREKSSAINKELLHRLNSSGKLHMVPASLSDNFVIRFCVCAERATDRDITIAVEHIMHVAQQLLTPTGLQLFDITEGNDEESAVDQEANRVRRIIPDNIDESTGANRLTLEDRRNQTLAQKRSYFVRMVSDPKCYNPKIIRHLQGSTPSQRQDNTGWRRDEMLRSTITQSSPPEQPNLGRRRSTTADRPMPAMKELSINETSEELSASARRRQYHTTSSKSSVTSFDEVQEVAAKTIFPKDQSGVQLPFNP